MNQETPLPLAELKKRLTKAKAAAIMAQEGPSEKELTDKASNLESLFNEEAARVQDELTAVATEARSLERQIENLFMASGGDLEADKRQRYADLLNRQAVLSTALMEAGINVERSLEKGRPLLSPDEVGDLLSGFRERA